MTAPPPSLDFFERLVKLDRKEARAVVDRYMAGSGDALGLYDEVLGPALVHAGREWECGRISVAHEHFISEVVLDLIHRHGPGVWAEAPAGASVGVACCAPRDRHSIGLSMVVDALRCGGVEVHLLGESLPAEAVVDFLGRVEADLLCLSCALDIHLPDAAGLIALARQARPGLLVAVGGPALRVRREETRAYLGADLTAVDARAVRQSLPDWLRRLNRPLPDPSSPSLHTGG